MKNILKKLWKRINEINLKIGVLSFEKRVKFFQTPSQRLNK